MSATSPRAKLLLMKEFERGVPANAPQSLQGLQQKLGLLPEFLDVQLTANGVSTVAASVPARNQSDVERLKALVNERVDGWRAIDEQSYGLPTTF